MIRNTFSHLPGVTETTEKKLWLNGIGNWENLYNDCSKIFSPKKSEKILRALETSIKKHENGDLYHFYETLPRQHLWRLLPGNEQRTAFIDIETTGLGLPPSNIVTTIAILFNGKLYQAHDLPAKKKLVRMIKDQAKVLVSYYGEVFDIPFLERQFKTEFNLAHVDLCFALRRHGLTGGLKVVEKKAKIPFKRKLVGLDGFDAVHLWGMFKNGNKRALDTLMAYNAEDTLVLQPLAEKLLMLESKKYPTEIKINFGGKIPSSKYKACGQVIRQIMKMKVDY